MNTDEEVEKRWKAAFMVINPEEYYRQFPKSPEQLQAEADAAASFAPMPIEDYMAQSTPEARAEMENAFQSLFDIDGPPEAKDLPAASASPEWAPWTDAADASSIQQ